MEKYDDFFKQDWTDKKITKTQKVNLDFSYQKEKVLDNNLS